MDKFSELIGESARLRTVTRSANVVAATDVTTLILGESGTGKELLAHAMHQASRRADKPFVIINCAAMPDGLAESELFGHRKGAFTGATVDHNGRVHAADGGTLFLDEIGELSLAIQVKLLRFLETGECQRLGEQTMRRIDTRVIAATNRDLYALVKAGRFREDLYYRLHVVPLVMPPLRERRGDVPRLLNHLTAKLAENHGLSTPQYSDEAIAILEQYEWPGNVRELRNFCERIVILMAGQIIGKNNLPYEFRRGGATGDVPMTTLPESGINLGALEVSMIRQALSKTQGNRSRAARLLGVTRDTLLYRIKKYAIQA